MRRITKKILFFFLGLLLIGFYCEYIIYYVVILQCYWPTIETSHGSNEILQAFILSDTHLLGPYRGHWLDKWRREWQMHRAFQTIISLHKPDVVFILGDLFDEGEWTDNKQFKEYVSRFHRLFSVPNSIKMFVVVGNHDIGFHNRIRRGFAERFSKLLKAPSIQHLVLKNNHFVLINSMALEGDSCNLCTEARRQIENVSEKLFRCAHNPVHCVDDNSTFNYSQPILMQHFPLYRVSDAICTDPDAPPLPEKNKLFRLKIDALSKEATNYLVRKIKPRAVFGGHTHHGCLVEHSYKEPDAKFLEYSVPSFSWRNRPNPKYMLATIAPDVYAVQKCGLPRESTIALTAIIMISILVGCLLTTRSLGRDYF
ncbi:metallophosphoesterase 1 [Melitaea cinxia]|uniref:metallophosphoesterase 1 n=1 Tax=Melitaea cinxia TaxID=113334 RepID=UPI001E271376|nr:metallophosphoesterase 1 [Melitaea cinxia]